MTEPEWAAEARRSRESVSQGHARANPQPTRYPAVTPAQLDEKITALPLIYHNDGTVDMLRGWLRGGEFTRVGWWLDHGQPARSAKSQFMGTRASIQSIRKRRPQ